MRRGEAFQSSYVKTEDLQGREHQLIIDRVEMGQVMNQDTNQMEEKAVIFFQGKSKGMILNVTNWDTLEEVYGEESDDWSGQPVILYPTTTRFGSKKVPCMRLRIPKGSELPKAPGHAGADLSAPPPPPMDEPPPPDDSEAPPESWETDKGVPF